MSQTLSCVVTDDEPIARNILRDYIRDCEDLELIGECKNVFETETLLSKHDIDILFLDIEMPKMNGIQFLKSGIQTPSVIFTTAHPDYALEAFEHDVIDYLLKPIAFERFLKAISKARKIVSSQSPNKAQIDWISIKEGKRLYKLMIDDILYLQAYGDYVRIFTSEKVYLTKSTLTQLLLELPDQILQIHRSYAVHLKYVNYVEGNMIQLGSTQLPLSKAYKDLFLRRM